MTTPENMELIALEKMINGSDAMFERRRRILREVRAMIREKGLDDVNMRDLSQRANVSTKTIYNAFGNKENVIALALYTYFQQFATHITFEEDAVTFAGALARQTTSTLRDVDVPNYMKAVVSLYFSPTLQASIRAVLINLATRSWVPWLEHVEDQRWLQRAVVPRELMIDLSSIQYACILEWCSGSLSDEVFVRRTLSGILTLLMGACTGQAHQQLEQAFFELQTNSAYRETTLAAARTRITEALESRQQSRGRRRTPAKAVF